MPRIARGDAAGGEGSAHLRSLQICEPGIPPGEVADCREPARNRSVRIDAGRIAEVVEARSEHLKDGGGLDLEGRWLMPGLINAHDHLTLQGLLTTGDGTRGNPYVVCHAADEHDVVAALGHEAAGQSLVEHEGRLCDVLVCSDGREVWFDVTDLLVRRAARKPLIGKGLRAKRRKPRASRLSR